MQRNCNFDQGFLLAVALAVMGGRSRVTRLVKMTDDARF